MAKRLLQLGGLVVVTGTIWAQLPPPPAMGRPPMRDERSLAERLADARQRRDRMRAVDTTAQRALEYSKVYLDRAEKALRSDQAFVCDRLLATAESLRRVAQVREDLHEPDRIRERELAPRPGRPGSEEDRGTPRAAGDLERVYFRVQQADFFYEQSHDTEAKAFPKWAKDFYQLSVRAMDRQDPVAASANARCADEVVQALENLAQAAAPMPPPPGGPHRRQPPALPDGPYGQPPQPAKPEPAARPNASSYSASEGIFG